MSQRMVSGKEKIEWDDFFLVISFPFSLTVHSSLNFHSTSIFRDFEEVEVSE